MKTHQTAVYALDQDWADCVERSKGQVSSCTMQLKKFRECHNQNKT
jgi:hypothetical protein